MLYVDKEQRHVIVIFSSNIKLTMTVNNTQQTSMEICIIVTLWHINCI